MKRTYLVLIITMLVIGFAAVATNLAINGTINFGFNSNNFNDSVVFTYTNTMNGTATIAENGKSITFKTTKLEDVGQKAIMDFDIANKSSQYDANVTIECGLENEFQSYSQYLEITQDLSDDAFKINAGETKSGRLTITLKKAYNESQEKDIDMLCTIKATPEERDTEGTYTPKEHEYEEILLNGADPVLEATPVEGISLAAETSNKKLIPVTIDEDGKVTRADTTKEWYNYEKKEWANAVILVEGAEDPGINQTILEEQIESYFVWIPKYRYKIFDMGQYENMEDHIDESKENKSIEIEFGLEDTEDTNVSCKTPDKSGENGTCKVGYWMTHPAFTAFEGSHGMWVGKFETGYNGASSALDAQKDESNSTKVIIKPNVYSWRYVNLSNAYKTSYDYKRELDSHMMKNTEWGAVAYLSHSIYGTCSNNKCMEVRINNSQNFVTGVAAVKEPDIGVGYTDYKETTPKQDNDKSFTYPKSINASTTLNNTGIFDMSGGAWEVLASVMQDSSGQPKWNKSSLDFDKLIDKKYYNLYNYYNTDYQHWERRILGDATGEIGPFMLVGTSHVGSIGNDCSDFLPNSNDQGWFVRSGRYTGGKIDGLFYFSGGDGSQNDNASFRIVLTPQ